MIYPRIPTCVLLLTLISLCANAVPPSPAGGNFLALDGIDDYAKLDFETFGILLPEGKFRNDGKTVALWHFDEPSTERMFLDSSGNGYHLLGKNGAKTGNLLSVDAQGKLTTTWGQLKK